MTTPDPDLEALKRKWAASSALVCPIEDGAMLIAEVEALRARALAAEAPGSTMSAEDRASKAMAECVAKNGGENMAYYLAQAIRDHETAAAEALRARVAELEKDLAEEESEAEHYLRLAIVDPGANDQISWKDRAEAAEAREVELAGALDFYAAEASWQWDIAPDPAETAIPGSAPAECDHGNIARAALAATPADALERARAKDTVVTVARQCVDRGYNGDPLVAALDAALAKLDAGGKEEKK